jgi:hypothetical protein
LAAAWSKVLDTLPDVTDDGDSPETVDETPRARSRTVGLVWLGLLVLLGIAVGVGIWLVFRGDDDSPATGATTLSVKQLTQLAKGTSRPIYWAGAEPNTTYELTQTEDGDMYLRYLPAGAKVGDPNAKYFTVGTYAQVDAFAKLKATAQKQGVETITVAGGGLAFQDKTHPRSVYIAYPQSDYQIEVYHPVEGRAKALVRSGRITRLGAPVTPARPSAASEEQLKQLAAELGHPVYWAGAEAGMTYELTRTPRGRVYIRYLPQGVAVGSKRADFLTVGTYPQENALEVLKATAKKSGATTVELDGGGLAMIDPKRPTSVYIALRGQDLQIEVYDPSAPRARKLVTSGEIEPVG